ncbi:hypothetical protein LY78DRAFT_61489 [Colletotrichum sublineola]|nr:hypothetical protein LY78DRAFT_61489 [Colletotrichum sublineola]
MLIQFSRYTHHVLPLPGLRRQPSFTISRGEGYRGSCIGIYHPSREYAVSSPGDAQSTPTSAYGTELYVGVVETCTRQLLSEVATTPFRVCMASSHHAHKIARDIHCVHVARRLGGLENALYVQLHIDLRNLVAVAVVCEPGPQSEKSIKAGQQSRIMCFMDAEIHL